MLYPLIQQQLERDEGRRDKGYLCSGGYWTIGVGHNVEAGPAIPGSAIDIICENDIRLVMDQISKRLPWALQLDPVRHGALVNLTFNIGIDNVIKRNPQMLLALQAKDWNLAAQELLDGNYKDQVGQRAYRLAKQFEGGQWT